MTDTVEEWSKSDNMKRLFDKDGTPTAHDFHYTIPASDTSDGKEVEIDGARCHNLWLDDIRIGVERGPKRLGGSYYYGKCEDCGRIGILVKGDACSDPPCCFKYVCESECMYKCHDCGSWMQGRSTDYEYNGPSEETCKVCGASGIPNFVWWGLYEKEYAAKYG